MLKNISYILYWFLSLHNSKFAQKYKLNTILILNCVVPPDY